MPFNQILDGYIYAVLTHQNMSLSEIYNAYMVILSRHCIPEPDDFMLMIKTAEHALASSYQEQIMQSVCYMHDFVTQKI